MAFVKLSMSRETQAPPSAFRSSAVAVVRVEVREAKRLQRRAAPGRGWTPSLDVASQEGDKISKTCMFNIWNALILGGGGDTY